MTDLLETHSGAPLNFESAEVWDKADVEGLVDKLFESHKIGAEDNLAYLIHETAPEFASAAVGYYWSHMRSRALFRPYRQVFYGSGGKLHRDVFNPRFTANRLRRGTGRAIVLSGIDDSAIVSQFRNDRTGELTQDLIRGGVYTGPPIVQAVGVDLVEGDTLIFNARKPHGFTGSENRAAEAHFLTVRGF